MDHEDSRAYEEELRWVRREKGTRRSKSRDTPGYDRELLRDGDTGELRGPSESRPADINDIVRTYGPAEPTRSTEVETFPEMLARIAIEAVAESIRELASDPDVREAVSLILSEKWSTVKRKSAELWRKHGIHIQSSRMVNAVPVENTEEAHAVVGESIMGVTEERAVMSGEEFRARLRLALAAEEFAADQKRLLASVRIDNDALPQELQDAFQAALEGNLASLDPEVLALVMAFLVDVRSAGGEYALVRIEEPEGPLELPSAEHTADKHSLTDTPPA